MQRITSRSSAERVIWTAFALLIWIGYRSLYLRGAGTGDGEFLGLFSYAWGAGLLMFFGLCLVLLALSVLNILNPSGTGETWLGRLENLADRVGGFRWLIVGAFVLFPSVLVFGPWGWRFNLPDFQLLLLVIAGLGSGLMFPKQAGNRWLRWGLATYVAGSIFVLGQRFVLVTDYPFSLTWSEGNRIWDYSLYFERSRYVLPQEYFTPTYLTPGRHGLWGLPFLLFPDISIMGLRIWDAILWTVPYLLLGAALFYRRATPLHLSWKLILSLWALLFLSQGPVYAPLILSAILVAWSYDRTRPQRTLVITFVACFYAGISRWTWMFAPAIWASLWALVENDRSQKWRELLKFPLLIGISGGLGALFSQAFMALAYPQPASVYATSLSQPLLWYRLWANPTNPAGVIPKLLSTVGPFFLLLGWMFLRKRLRWTSLQFLGAGAGIVAFLIAGLVASVKIGGGSNLHNLDMFLVTILILSGLLVRRNGILEELPPIVGVLLAIIWIIPLWTLSRDTNRLEIPTDKYVKEAMATIRLEVNKAAENGEVLFIDQRQLLTFGEIEGIPLIMDYELKHVMNQAMAHNTDFFEAFYTDLEAQRFALIVSDPLPVVFQGPRIPFGEENDAWVEEVTIPLLEYYEPIEKLDGVQVWLLAPITPSEDGE